MNSRDDFPTLARIADGGQLPGRTMLIQVSQKALDEIDHLRRWKAEAIAVSQQWDEVWEILGKPGPFGGSIADNSLAKITRMKSYIERLREELAKHGWGDFHYGETPQDPAIIALLAEEP